MRIDAPLVRRLERTAASALVAVTGHIDRADPGRPAAALAFGDGALIAMGAGRYVNRAVGVTLDPLGPDDVVRVEQFFEDHGVAPAFELSSWADPGTIAALRAAGYGPDWFRSVFAAPPTEVAPALSDDAIRIEEVDDDRVGEWLAVLAHGNGIVDPAARSISDELARANRSMPGTTDSIALVDGALAGCGSLQIVDGVAWLGGAATAPQWRRRGVQSALLHHRCALAAASGAELVAATAVSSGTSARNLVAAGLVHVETQLVVRARHPSEPVRPP